MNDVYDAARDLQDYCRNHGWGFCLIGGIAVQRWRAPRFAKDADMTLLTWFVHDEDRVETLLKRFASVRPNPFEFAQRTRVLPLRYENGVTMDGALGALDFEVRSVERASAWVAPSGDGLITCSAEDLVVHKAFASRDRDWDDVQRIIAVQGRKLNIPQIFEELRPLADLKEDDGIVTRLEWEMKTQGLL